MSALQELVELVSGEDSGESALSRTPTEDEDELSTFSPVLLFDIASILIKEIFEVFDLSELSYDLFSEPVGDLNIPDSVVQRDIVIHFDDEPLSRKQPIRKKLELLNELDNVEKLDIALGRPDGHLLHSLPIKEAGDFIREFTLKDRFTDRHG